MPDRDLANEALPWVRPVKKWLAAHNLTRGFRSRWNTGGGVDELYVFNSVPINFTPTPALPGRWELHIRWTLRRNPADERFVVWQSSVGLSASGIEMARDAGTDKICLVRYDVDHARIGHGVSGLGRHLNIHQPPPLGSHAHFAIPGDESEWNVPQVLEVLLSSSLFEDLDGRIQ
jgi:hypothetical protein